jgi:hypothetical protein
MNDVSSGCRLLYGVLGVIIQHQDDHRLLEQHHNLLMKLHVSPGMFMRLTNIPNMLKRLRDVSGMCA